MSYGADDPDGLLGRNNRRIATRPTGANRSLSGDVKTAALARQVFQLIDVEYESPMVLAIQCKARPLVVGSVFGTPAIWRIRAGLDRTTLETREYQQGDVSITTVARSLSVTAETLSANQTVSAICVPVDMSCDVGALSAFDAKSASINATDSMVMSAPQTPLVGSPSTLDTLLSAYGAAINPAVVDGYSRFYGSPYNRRGFTVMNATAVDMFLMLGTPATGTAAGSYTIKIVAGGYYEGPFGYGGPLDYWFASAGAGLAYFTVLGAR